MFSALILVLGVVAVGSFLRCASTIFGDKTPADSGSKSFEFSSVSFVVPARNEAESVELCIDAISALATALKAVHRDLVVEIVLVDDDSSDRTAQLAAGRGATVVSAPGIAQGSNGKACACEFGSRSTTGDLLVFVDSDVEVAQGLSNLINSVAAQEFDLISVQPFHAAVGLVESMAILFNAVSLMSATFPCRRTNAPLVVFGPIVITTRTNYEAVGGYARVATQVVEDIALGSNYRMADKTIAIRSGRKFASFRMYRGGFGALVEGFSKNIAFGARAVGPVGGIAGFVFVGALVLCSLDGFGAIMALFADKFATAAIDLGLYVFGSVMLSAAVGKIGSYSKSAVIFYPVPVAIFLIVSLRSVFWLFFRQKASWKGRTLLNRDPDGG